MTQPKQGAVSHVAELFEERGVEFRNPVAVHIRPQARHAVEVPFSRAVDEPTALRAVDDQRLDGIPLGMLREGVPQVGLIEGGEIFVHAGRYRAKRSPAAGLGVYVSPFFTQPVITADQQAALSDVARLLADKQIRHLPVVDPKGRMTGVLTDMDLYKAGRLTAAGVWAWNTAGNNWMRARDVSITDPLRVLPDLSLPGALQRLLADRHRLVIAMDAFKRPIGLFTERDAIRIAVRVLPAGRPVDLAQTAPLLVSPSDRAGEVLRLMDTYRVRHIPVVLNGEVVGTVSRRDLLKEDAFGHPQVRLADLGATSVAVVGPDGLSAKEIAKRIYDTRVGCVALLDPNGRVVRVATTTDVIKALHAMLGSMAADR